MGNIARTRLSVHDRDKGRFSKLEEEEMLILSADYAVKDRQTLAATSVMAEKGPDGKKTGKIKRSRHRLKN